MSKVRPKIGETEIRQSTNKESINRYLFDVLELEGYSILYLYRERERIKV